MTLPVSSYEQLLDQVREITNETILLRQQLSYDLQDNGDDATDVNHNVALRRHQNGRVPVTIAVSSEWITIWILISLVFNFKIF